MVDVRLDDALKMRDEIDYAHDVSNVNEQSFDERIMDHRSNHFENAWNNPMKDKRRNSFSSSSNDLRKNGSRKFVNNLLLSISFVRMHHSIE